MASGGAGAAEAVRTGLGFHGRMVAATVGPWCFVLAAYLASAGGSWLVAALAAVGTAHVGLTGAFYLDPEARPILRSNPARYVVAPLCLFVGGVALVVFAPRPVVELAVVGLGVWRVHHFTKQNLGIFAFLAKARGESGPSPDERKVIGSTTAIGLLGLASLLGSSSVLDAGLVVAPVLRAAGIALVIVTAGRVLMLGPVNTRTVTLLGAVAFYAPLFVWHANPVPAVAAYGAAHAAQYWLMMVELRGGRDQAGSRHMTSAVALAALTFGWAHVLHSRSTSWAFGLFLGMTAVHFVVDAGVWKLRDPEQRAYMQRRFDFL